MKRVKNINIIFTLLIVTYPILSVYCVGINNLSVGDFLLIIMVSYLVIIDLKQSKLEVPKNLYVFWVFIIYFVILLIVQPLYVDQYNFFSMIRYMLYILAIVLGEKYFDFEYAISLVIKLTVLISVYVIMQFIFLKAASIVLPWHVNFLEIMAPSFDEFRNSPYFFTYYRPRGVFMEPTHYAQFCVVALSFLICKYKISHKDYISICIIVLGILCSGSSLGIIEIALLFCIFILKGRLHMAKKISILISGVVLFIGAYQIEYFRTIITRMQADDGSFTGPAVGYRFANIEYLLEQKRTIFEMVLGIGRGGDQTRFYPDYFYMLNTIGILGLILFVLVYLNCFCYGKSFSRTLILTLSILSIGSDYMSNFGFLYCLIFSVGEYRYSKKGKQTPFQKNRAISVGDMRDKSKKISE